MNLVSTNLDLRFANFIDPAADYPEKKVLEDRDNLNFSRNYELGVIGGDELGVICGSLDFRTRI